MNKQVTLFALAAVLSGGAMGDTYVIDSSRSNFSCTSDNPSITPQPLNPLDMFEVNGSPQSQDWSALTQSGVKHDMTYIISKHQLQMDKTVPPVKAHETIDANFSSDLSQLTLSHITLNVTNSPVPPSNFTITCKGPLVYKKVS